MNSHSDDSRVAFDLAQKIHGREYPGPGSVTKENAREYWLQLYGDCLQAVLGNADTVVAMVKKRQNERS